MSGHLYAPAALPPGKEPRYPLDWVGHRAGLNDVEKRKFWPYRDSNSDPSFVQPVTRSYSDYAIPAPRKIGLIKFLYAMLNLKLNLTLQYIRGYNKRRMENE
jgi:hypothetical protein